MPHHKTAYRSAIIQIIADPKDVGIEQAYRYLKMVYWLSKMAKSLMLAIIWKPLLSIMAT